MNPKSSNIFACNYHRSCCILNIAPNNRYVSQTWRPVHDINTSCKQGFHWINSFRGEFPPCMLFKGGPCAIWGGAIYGWGSHMKYSKKATRELCLLWQKTFIMFMFILVNTTVCKKKMHIFHLQVLNITKLWWIKLEMKLLGCQIQPASYFQFLDSCHRVSERCFLIGQSFLPN